VPECTYPLTGVACVSRVYTDHALFDLTGGEVVVLETYGISVAELRSRVDVPLAAA
jgi:3-oxoadipate CoA-transferase beta subunit